MPKVAELHKEIYGWVDRGNQQLSYNNTEFRSVRKQNRVVDSLTEMYVLVNGHTLWRKSPNLMCNVTRENMSQREFRFAVWYAVIRKTNGRMEVHHYPSKRQTHHRRSLALTVTSTKRGPTTYKEFPRKILQAKINELNAAYLARKHPSNPADVQALETLWSFAVQRQVDSAESVSYHSRMHV